MGYQPAGLLVQERSTRDAIELHGDGYQPTKWLVPAQYGATGRGSRVVPGRAAESACSSRAALRLTYYDPTRQLQYKRAQ
eukprot:3117459-Rhodomonas_salina.1